MSGPDWHTLCSFHIFNIAEITLLTKGMVDENWVELDSERELKRNVQWLHVHSYLSSDDSEDRTNSYEDHVVILETIARDYKPPNNDHSKCLYRST